MGQNNHFSQALLIDDSEINDKITEEIHNFIVERIVALNSENILLYDWEEKTKKVTFSAKNKYPEKPAESVIFVKATGQFDFNPELEVVTDTSGKTTKVNFLLNASGGYLNKKVDLSTSTIIDNDIYGFIPAFVERFPITDFIKVFGGDPATLRKNNFTKFESIKKQLWAKHESEFEKIYKNKFNLLFISSIFVKSLISADKEKFKVIVPANITEKKLSSISFAGGLNDNIFKGDYYTLFQKNMMGNHVYYEDIITLVVDEVGEKQSTAKTSLFASEKLAEALKSGNELWLIHQTNFQTINELNVKPGTQKVNLAIKKTCLMCEPYLETKLFNCPTFNLVERNAKELAYFAKLSKNDRFIDYSLEDLQGKKLGYELLITEDEKFMNIVEVSTNKTVHSFKKRYKLLTETEAQLSKSKDRFNLNIYEQDILRLLSAYRPESFKVEWITTLKTKKDKIEEIAIYHPAGMERYVEFNIYTLESEQVDGETIQRKNKIARGTVGKTFSPTLYELNIKDGEKELFKAEQGKIPVLIEVSDKI